LSALGVGSVCKALKEFNMKRYVAAVFLVALAFAGTPSSAQLLQKLEQGLMGGQGQGLQQGMMPGQQPQMLGNVNLPPGQYMMTNVQTGQAFYVMIQNGQMFLTRQQMAPQMMAPGQGMMQQQGGPGGLMNGGGGLGNFLKNELEQQPQMRQ
jgi:hypothetical protein